MPKPSGPCFDSSWRTRTVVRVSTITECDRFFRAHYLKRRPAVVTLVLAVVVDGVPRGMVCFALPPHETSTRYGCTVWELARLYLEDSMPSNTESFVIAQAIRYIRSHHRDVAMLVSYADPSFGHLGVIYKASNWKPDGRTDDNRKTPRFDMIEHSTDLLGSVVKRYSRASRVPSTAVTTRLPRASKHRYVYAL